MTNGYRTEIDGLRALAILPVVLLHGGLSGISGGFIGVDVFFVISGYLITSILLREFETQTFSLKRFYLRRAKRILPALFVVLLICVPASWVFLSPKQLESFFESLASVLLFGSNFYFWLTSGYFSPEAAELPLIHTWSLAIEEQFYVFFPLALFTIYKFGHRPAFWLLISMTIISLGIAHWASSAHSVAGFYLIFTRAWELLVGALCAFFPMRLSRIAHQATTSVAFAALLLSFFLFDEGTRWPSLYSLVPILASAVLIVFTNEKTWVYRILSLYPLRLIGLISYSVYLWHQPIFVYAHINHFANDSSWQKTGLLVLPFLLGWISWRWIETPFRTGHIKLWPLIPVGFVTACVAALGILFANPDDRLPPNVDYWSMGDKTEKVGLVCQPKAVSGYDKLQACVFGNTTAQRQFVLYGDSHAKAISYELDAFFKANNIKGISVKMENCSVIPRIVVNDPSDITHMNQVCLPAFQEFIDFVKRKADGIILSSRWTFRLFPVIDQIDMLAFDNKEGGIEVENYREYGAILDTDFDKGAKAKTQAIQDFLSAFVKTGKQVILLDNIPEIGWDIARENFDFYSRTGEILQNLSVSSAQYDHRHRFLHGILDAFTKNNPHPNYYRIKMRDVFCDQNFSGRCTAQEQGVPYYYDDDHLSSAGAKRVINHITPLILP